MPFNLFNTKQKVSGISYYDYCSDHPYKVDTYLSALLEENDKNSPSTTIVRYVISDTDIIHHLDDINKALGSFAFNQYFIVCELGLSDNCIASLASCEQDTLKLRALAALCDVVICEHKLLLSFINYHSDITYSVTQSTDLLTTLNINTLIIKDTGQSCWTYIDAQRQARFSYSQQQLLNQAASTPLTYNDMNAPGLLSATFACFLLFNKRSCDAFCLALAYINQQAIQKWPAHLSNFASIKTSINTNNTLPSFASTETLSLGLYPVVDSLQWLEDLLKQDIKTIQLRIKDTSIEELDLLIEKAAALGKEYQARLFINDYWQLAIKHDCYGVHLGQEDLDSTDLTAIQKAGLRLGVSTHSEYEWLRALAIKPSYIAMGTVYTTQTKPAILIGLVNLSQWCRILANHIPIVAIGGIKLNNIDPVLKSGVGSIAVVTAITLAQDYKRATELLNEKQQIQYKCA